MSVLADRVVAIAVALDRAGIAHAFGGALAYAYAVAEPRGTRDIDVNVFVLPAEARRVFEALPDGVAFTDDDVKSVERDEQVRLFWDETPVDLFFIAHDFHASVQRTTRRVPLLDHEIDVLDATHLTVCKVMFDRTKDWADIEEMCAAGTVDIEVATRWLTEILGPDDDRIQRLRGLVA